MTGHLIALISVHSIFFTVSEMSTSVESNQEPQSGNSGPANNKKSPTRRRVTVPRLIEMKQQGKKITMLTAYDYPMASLLDAAGVDTLLVGDSMAMVVQGHENTLPVTLDEMIYHAEMVGRAAKRALVVVDLPFPINHQGYTKR